MRLSIESTVSRFAKRINSNDFINFLITTLLFLFLGGVLAAKDRTTPAIVGIFLLTFCLSIYLGSVSALVLVTVSSVFTLATLTSIYRGLFNFPVSTFGAILSFSIIAVIFIFTFKKILKIQIRWTLHLLPVLFAALSFFLIADPRLFRRSGAISALYAWEDNAAWVLMTHKTLNQNLYKEGGVHGSLMDTLLWFSHAVSTSVFPKLTAPDHLATSVIILTLLFILVTPFLATLPNLNYDATGKGAVASTAVLSIGSMLGFLQLNSIGHLSAAISCLLLTIYLCISFVLPDSEHSGGIRHLLLFHQILLAYLAGVTWWPIAPLSATLIVFSIWRAKQIVSTSKKIQLSYLTLTFVLVYLLIYLELLRRFAGYQTAGDGVISGATTLLSSQGGNTIIEPWNLLVIILYSMILLLGFVTLGLKANTGLMSFVLLMSYVYAIKFINLRLDEGVAAYGARKLEIVLVLIGASFLSWGLVVLFEKYLSNKISPLIPGLLVSVFLLSMPVAYAIIPGNYFAGLDWKPNVKTSKVISKEVEVGRATVCLNETYQADAFRDLRLGAYICSRWVSAYSNIDTVATENWKMMVLGGGDPEALRVISEALPADTMLIVVGPEDNERVKNNPEWNNLVRKSWEVVR